MFILDRIDRELLHSLERLELKFVTYDITVVILGSVEFHSEIDDV